jgi:diguanylate cyclase (GGDEF)-like protein
MQGERMGQNNKLLIIIVLSAGALLGAGLFEPIRSSLFTFASLAATLLFFMWKALYKTSKRFSSAAKQPLPELLNQISHVDSVTTLPTRIFFNEVVNKTLNLAKRHNKILAVLLIELDEEADSMELKEIANHFTKVLRKEDTLARLDENQFAVLLSEITKPKFASTVAEKLLKSCKQTLSIGICIYPHDGQSLEELLQNAESALCKVKHAGGADYQFYTEKMDREAREYIQLESALRKAILNNELTLYYQPKLSIKKGRIVGAEALMRWEHPVLGMVNPQTFIALAEEIGLAMQLAEWGLRQACITNKSWQNEGYEHLTMSVNLSSKQFNDPKMPALITKVLEETGLNPPYLELEIAENVIMENTMMAATILEKLKETGIHISIDHFGTGQTAISCLKKFPISTIKIDQSFIKGVPYIPNDLAITNAFIALAHHLGLEVVAEGVETAEQLQYLSDQACDLVQGYFLSQPVPAAKFMLQMHKLNDDVLL